MKAKLNLEIHDRERSKEAKIISDSLAKFNAKQVGCNDARELTISFKNSKRKIVAGLNGRSSQGWLFIKAVWVSDEFRGKGIGKKLMLKAESEAKKRKCTNIWLDTFAFQSPKFYEKIGYKKFGELVDYPKGYKRLFYTKRVSK